MTIPAGTLVPRDAREFGSYELLAKLATGGMAEIFLGRPYGASRQDVVVIKRILPHLAEDEHFVTMFRDEANLASRLIHPSVCRVHALGHHAMTWYIVMEYLHGVPLSRMMTRLSQVGKLIDQRVVANIIVQACEGLHHAHELRGTDGALLGVVHRDVSPPNIMVNTDGSVKLLDFGIAKARGANSRTRTGTVKGKNAYMSPEQILGKPLDRRSDVFALGVVMYEMLAIRRLFHRDSDFLTFKAITEEAIPDIAERRSDLPEALRAAITRALAREPEERFATAKEFADAIRRALGGASGLAPSSAVRALLASDFADELAVHDEILRAADELTAGPVPVPQRGSAPMFPAVRPTPVPEQSSALGEVAVRPRRASSPPTPQAPSMIVEPGATPSGFARDSSSPVRQIVPDVTAKVAPLAAPSAMLPAIGERHGDLNFDEPSTDLLRLRTRGLRRMLLGVGAVGTVLVGAIWLMARDGGEPRVGSGDDELIDAGAPVAAPAAPPVDPGPSRADIVALSKVGFFSIASTAKMTVFIDGLKIGDAPIARMALAPGIHKIKLVGPRGKQKKLDTTILGGRDTDEGSITWP